MKRMLMGVGVLVTAATSCSLAPVGPATPGPQPKEDCAPGIEVVVWFDESTPCNLDGSQTLVLLGLPNEAACDEHGGRWVYEACEDADY